MPINATVKNEQISVAVGETQIGVTVNGGVGPTGNSGTITVSAPITNAGSSTAAVIGLSTGTGLAVSGDSLVVSYGTTAGTACQGNDARLSDSREWSADTVSQAEAEAGTATTRRAFTALRVFQAIAAWWSASAAKTKLDGIATGATANATDAQLRDRSTHTGTQLAATISDFTTAVVAAAPPTTNASLLTSGTLPDARLSGNIARTTDVSSAVAALVASAPATLDTLNELAAALGNDASFSTTVTNALAAKAPLASPTFTGTVSGITASMVGLGNVPNVDATARANHTGTQAIATVDGLQTALDGKAVTTHNHGNINTAGNLGSTVLDAVAVGGPVVFGSALGNIARGQFGSAAGQFCQGNDARLSDARTPSAHKSSHAAGGSDALTAADIGAAAATHASAHNPGGGDPVTLVEVYEFTRTTKPGAATGSNGSYTFTIPAAAKAVEFFAIGAGGGGGSGRRGAAGSARFGGGGGGSGGVMLVTRTVAELASRTVSIALGAGGAGAAAVTANDTNGNNGSNGVDTTLTISGRLHSASRGVGGSGGTAAAGTGGAGGNAQYSGVAGSNSSATASPNSATPTSFAAGGGGAGGGISTGGVSYGGAIGRAQGWFVGGVNVNSNGGTAPGGNGQHAADAYTQVLGAQPGGAGAGGAAGDATTAGGNGGDGANYGGAGGGGGASFNGYNSGAGGNGGDGYVRLTVWY